MQAFDLANSQKNEKIAKRLAQDLDAFEHATGLADLGSGDHEDDSSLGGMDEREIEEYCAAHQDVSEPEAGNQPDFAAIGKTETQRYVSRIREQKMEQESARKERERNRR